MYSLRSYARALAMDHGGLSRLLRGRGPISSRRVRQLGTRLCLPSNEVERLVACEDAGALLRRRDRRGRGSLAASALHGAAERRAAHGVARSVGGAIEGGFMSAPVVQWQMVTK